MTSWCWPTGLPSTVRASALRRIGRVFQGRETVPVLPGGAGHCAEKQMDKFAGDGPIPAVEYRLGAPDAEKGHRRRGSGAETVHETVNDLVAKSKKVGVLENAPVPPVRHQAFVAALPRSKRSRRSTARKSRRHRRTALPGRAHGHGRPPRKNWSNAYPRILGAATESWDRRNLPRRWSAPSSTT